MAKGNVKKQNPTAKAQSVEMRIVEVSLQHPELGARSLVPLLKKKRIDISATTIQNILRRHGLQTSENRLAQIKKPTQKTQKPESTPRKALQKIPDHVADRICEISLKNPDLGAKSLAPLLKEYGIFVSSSAVYRILRHYGLQTRVKRYTEIAEITAEPVIIPKPFLEKIPPEVEDRIIEASLQNPEFGARRLIPLLKQEEIFVSVSAVYRILKRHDLENRQKRFSKLEALKVQETQPEPELTEPELVEEEAEIKPVPVVNEVPEPIFEPAVAAPVPPVDEAPELAVEPEPISEPLLAEAAKPAKPERPPVRKPPVKAIKKRSHPAFYPLYLLLIALIGYLGFHAFQGIQYALLEAEATTAIEPAAAGISVKAESAVSELPLDGYRQIWERNLFNVAKTTNSTSENKIAIEEVTPAKKELGLKLMGTVASDNVGLRRAFIHSSRTRGQRAYREGDAAVDVRIKTNQRNSVIVSTEAGDRLLMVDIGGAKEGGLQNLQILYHTRSSSRQA